MCQEIATSENAGTYRACRDFGEENFAALPRSIRMPEITWGDHTEERAGPILTEGSGVGQHPCPIYHAASLVILSGSELFSVFTALPQPKES